MAKLEITLSRAHKIAERLKGRAAEKSAEAERLSASPAISGLTGEGQIERLQAQAVKALDLSAQSERLTRAAAHVRAAIGHENEKRGINSMLALGDAVNRVLTAKKAMSERARDGSVSAADLVRYKPLQEEASYGSGSVRVNLFTDAQRETLEAEVSKLQREAFGLADRVAEANAARFALELDDEIAQEATGS